MASTGDAALIAAWREFQDFHDALVSPSPYLTDGDFNELGEAKLSAIETVLAETPATTLEGLLAKASWAWTYHSPPDLAWEEQDEADLLIDERAVFSLMRDLRQLAGVAS